MNYTELIKIEIEAAYKTTEGLLDLVEDATLSWKPESGNNWMTVAQLIKHTLSNGMCFTGFATGDWGMPKDVGSEKMPPAEALPSVQSVAEARLLLAEDRKVALEVLSQCDENRLANDPAPAPWDPRPLNLGYRLLQMVAHLNQHKAQLFYYLKLQGKPVHTGHLWGM